MATRGPRSNPEGAWPNSKPRPLPRPSRPAGGAMARGPPPREAARWRTRPRFAASSSRSGARRRAGGGASGPAATRRGVRAPGGAAPGSQCAGGAQGGEGRGARCPPCGCVLRAGEGGSVLGSPLSPRVPSPESSGEEGSTVVRKERRREVPNPMIQKVRGVGGAREGPWGSLGGPGVLPALTPLSPRPPDQAVYEGEAGVRSQQQRGRGSLQGDRRHLQIHQVGGKDGARRWSREALRISY